MNATRPYRRSKRKSAEARTKSYQEHWGEDGDDG